ncbi:MAG TPA: hypothetical protein VH518_10630 [Tepidisphaeraceae bacterium]
MVYPTRNTDPKRRRSAFTLAESLLAAVVLAIAVVGISSALMASQQQSRAMADDAVAITLARQLMEEIAAVPVVLSDGTTGVSGWPTDTTRAHYDTVDDFNGYRDQLTVTLEREKTVNGGDTFNNSATPPTTVIAPLAALQPLSPGQYRRVVTVSSPTFSALDTPGDFALVKVTVDTGSGHEVSLSRLIAKTTIVR